MGNPFFNKSIHNSSQSISKILDQLSALNIKFTNGNPNQLTANLFQFNEMIATGNTTDNNQGNSIQNTIVGASLPSDFCTQLQITDDYLFVSTNLGIWIYDRNTNTGVTINTTTAITGDDLPSNDVLGVFYDEYRYVLYAATNGGGLWIYNVATGVGQTINTGTVVLGDLLPNNVIYSISVDLVNNVVYAGTQGGLWQFTIATLTGKKFWSGGGEASGDPMPGDAVNSISIDYYNGYCWIGLIDGVWRLNIATLDGKTYTTTGGAGSGAQLPANYTWNVFHSLGTDTLFVGTANGIWAYNITLDFGAVINTSTPVIGDALPSDNDTVVLHDYVNNILYAGTDSGIWIYNMTLGTGKVWDTSTTPTTGDPLPSNLITRLGLDTQGNLGTSTYGGGIWILNLLADSTELFQAATPGGTYLPSNIVFGIGACESRNVMYAATLSGMYQYFVERATGKIYTSTGGAGSGDQLPSNICTSVYYDQTNNVVYIGTVLGLWRYNVDTDTGKKFTTTGGAGSGDQMPNNFVYGVWCDESTNRVFVATAGGFWIYTTGTDTGKAFTTGGGAGSGDQLPVNACNDCGMYPGSDYVWVITNGGGAWQYDTVLDVGKTFNTTGGAANGQQIPDNIGWSIALESTIVWFATNLGIWKYNVATDTGLVIDENTPVTSGDKLPEEGTIGITIDPVNQILWVGTLNYGIWEYQITPDTGKVYDTSGGQSGGTGVPANNIQALFYDATNSNLWAATKGGGVWQYILNNQGVIGSAFINLSTSVYDYISQCVDIINSPIVIFFMKITITGNLTLNNYIKYIKDDIFGNQTQRIIRLNDYVSALLNKSNDIIDIPIPDGILIDQDHYFEYPLDPLEEVDMTVYYARLELANILRRQFSIIELGQNINPFAE